MKGLFQDNLRFAAAAVIALAVSQGSPMAQASQPLPAPPGTEQLRGEHPAEYYKRAAVLFRHGKQDEAVFVFYLGQLRYRARLLAHPNLDPSGEPALFASLSQVVGKPLNEYAFGDIPRLLITIDAVLDYDLNNPDSFTPPMTFPDAWRQVREGLSQMRAQVERDANSIRSQRQKHGLPNR
jgi:hypothetical protein